MSIIFKKLIFQMKIKFKEIKWVLIDINGHTKIYLILQAIRNLKLGLIFMVQVTKIFLNLQEKILQELKSFKWHMELKRGRETVILRFTSYIRC